MASNADKKKTKTKTLSANEMNPKKLNNWIFVRIETKIINETKYSNFMIVDFTIITSLVLMQPIIYTWMSRLYIMLYSKIY